MDEEWCEGTLNGKKGRFLDELVRFQESAQLPPDPEESPNVRNRQMQ